MPRGPRGETRPRHVTGAVVQALRVATGEAEEAPHDAKKAKAGRAGGLARKEALTPERRREIAQTGVAARSR